jgi:hypothetical protein
MPLSPEERASLPASMQVPERSSRKVVEHTSEGSFADMSDLAERTPLSYRPNLRMHGVKQHIDCEATESADGHSGPATHFIRMPGERSDQVEAVCAVHHTRLTTNALEKGGYDVSSRRIRPDDVQPHLFHRAKQDRLVRTALETPLSSAGLTGEDAIFNRKSEELGKGGGKRTTHIEELKKRTTPEHAHSVVESALDHVRTHGGHNPPASAAPTIDFDGEDLTLGESYAKVASLRRKSEPDLDPKKPGNTKNYYMAGVVDLDGKEGVPTSTRRFGINKTGAPNPKGGRKKNAPTYDYDTSNQYKPGFTEEEKKRNPEFRKSEEERRAAGIPVGGIQPRGLSKKNNKAIKVTMDQLPITPYPTETPGIPDDAETIRASKKMQTRSTNRALKTMAQNAEGDRLREIESERVKKTESRNKAFKVDWNDVPRPE